MEKETDLVMLYRAIDAVVGHGIKNGLMQEADRTYAVNRILERLKLDAYEQPEITADEGKAAVVAASEARLTAPGEEKTTAERDGSVGKRDDSAGKRDDSAGKRDDSVGKRDDSVGKSDDSAGAGMATDTDFYEVRTIPPLGDGTPEGVVYAGLERALKVLLDYAVSVGLVENDSTVYRDLFDTEIMNCIMMRPSELIGRFEELYAVSPEKATDYYYAVSRASDYIRTYRIARDIKWFTDTEYGRMVITINLSKPEKDPKAIAAALTMKQSAYPKCQLCRTNEGYAGRINHPARATHRIVPITINNAPWFLQYSPYVYYNEHCIVFNSSHVPMKIDRAAFGKLLDFIELFPHYCVGSNADLPIVGGSILTHDHFQGGRYEFPMAKAPVEEYVSIRGFEDIKAGIVKWPMTVIRITGADKTRLCDCADAVLRSWREYTDEGNFIYAYSDASGETPVKSADTDYEHCTGRYVPHNTITPIARMRRNGDGTGIFELDLVLRNNITTPEHPLGVYHPHSEYHHIKKENIGLIEVMGLAILPARLKGELSRLRECIISNADISADEELSKHADWVDMIREKYEAGLLSDSAKVDEIIKDEVGFVYRNILEQCAVFKRDEKGHDALLKFIGQI